MAENEDKYLAIPAGRQKQVLEYVHKNESAQIKELADYFAVSEATIRRDLDELDSSGHIRRTHGGAVAMQASTSYEHMHSEKMKLMLDCKRKVARLAASQVKEGDTIILDSGTTTYFVAQNLSQIPNLTVITYDLFIANSVTLHDSSTLVVTGGIRRNGYNVLVGSEVENYISTIRVNKVFLGADAIDIDFGVSNANLMEAGIKRLLLHAGKEIILVSDHSKLGRTALTRICDLAELDTIIIDKDITEDMQKRLKETGAKLLLA